MLRSRNITAKPHSDAYRDIKYVVKIKQFGNAKKVTEYKTAGRKWSPIRDAPEHLIKSLVAGAPVNNRRETGAGFEQGEVIVRTLITRQGVWKRKVKNSSITRKETEEL